MQVQRAAFLKPQTCIIKLQNPTPPRLLQSKGDCSALDAELRACMARSRLQ